MELIVALDYASQDEILSCVQHWDPKWCILKIGLEAYTSLGPDIIRMLSGQGYRIFLDLKYHDIPNTVTQACLASAKLGVYMMNVHSSGGFKMMQQAHQALVNQFGPARPLLVAVTVLTSQVTTTQNVVEQAQLSYEAGLDGVVCSALEVPSIKAACGKDFLTVTPGIRFDNQALDDQCRVVTPIKAKQLGSDFIVMGRAITQSTHPTKTLLSLYETL